MHIRTPPAPPTLLSPAATQPRAAAPPPGGFQPPQPHPRVAPSPESPMGAAAAQFVSAALLQPLMKLAAESPLKSDLFGTGVANTAFKEQLHTLYAESVTRAADFPLTQRIAALNIRA